MYLRLPEFLEVRRKYDPYSRIDSAQRRSRSMRRRGLSDDLQPLATGVIGREVFEVAFPETVCDLGLGTTAQCEF